MSKIKALEEDENVILRGIKIRLFTTKEDEEDLKEMCYARNLAHDWATDKLWKNYNSYNDHVEDYRLLSFMDLNYDFTEYRKSDECNPILKSLGTGVAKVAFEDAINAFILLKKDIPRGGMKPRYHGKHNRENVTCGLRIDSSYIRDGKLHTSNLDGKPRLVIDLCTNKFDGYGGDLNRKGITKHWYNPRVIKETDGWYLGFARPIKRKSLEDRPWTEPIGIDLGCRTTFQLSTEEFFNQPDVSRDKDLIAKLDHDIIRLYKLRKKRAHKQGLHVWELPKSKNELELIAKRNKAYRRIHNKIEYFYYQVINDIVKRRPEAIVLETIYVRHLFRISKSTKGIRVEIAQVYFYMIRYMFEAKCDEYSIPLYEVTDNYPSTLLCNRCKHSNSEIGNNKTFICPVCGYTVDRDLNASFNLRDVYVNREDFNIKWWNGHGTKLVLKDKITNR